VRPYFNAKVVFSLKCEPLVQRSMETSDAGLSKPAFSASLSKFASHSSAGLSNLALHVRCGSEKPCVSLQT